MAEDVTRFDDGCLGYTRLEIPEIVYGQQPQPGILERYDGNGVLVERRTVPPAIRIDYTGDDMSQASRARRREMSRCPNCHAGVEIAWARYCVDCWRMALKTLGAALASAVAAEIVRLLWN